jgi:4-hydroxybutyrate CoA-transferase
MPSRTGPAKGTPEEVVACIQPDNRVFVHGAAATPQALLRELVRQAPRLHGVELIHLHTEGPAPYASDPELRRHFRTVNLFVGPNIRPYVNGEEVDYLPCFLSEIPALFRSGKRPIDVALLSVSSADAHGFHTLGTSVDVARAAADCAKVVLAQVNAQLPRLHGDGYLQRSKLSAFCEVDEPLPGPSGPPPLPTPLEQALAKNVASLIDDGSCLQVGIGSIPNAVLAALSGHRHLGVHTEMFSDGLLPLLQTGAVDNSLKKVHPGKTVGSFLLGSRSLYDFVDGNPSVILLGADYVNHPNTIARNPKAVAINSAVEIDLTGQVCADSVGHRLISGVGGQMDFMRGASLSPGGKAILALSSRTSRGKARIVAELTPGAGVVTTRAHVQWVVTEYGIADLSGKTLGERRRELTRIAHPEDRDDLERSSARS